MSQFDFELLDLPEQHNTFPFLDQQEEAPKRESTFPVEQSLECISVVVQRKQKTPCIDNKDYCQYWFDEEGRIPTRNLVGGERNSGIIKSKKFFAKVHTRENTDQSSLTPVRSLSERTIYLGLWKHDGPESLGSVERIRAVRVEEYHGLLLQMTHLHAVSPNGRTVSDSPPELQFTKISEGEWSAQCGNFVIDSDYIERVVCGSNKLSHFGFALFEKTDTLVKRISPVVGRFRIILWHSQAVRFFNSRHIKDLPQEPITKELWDEQKGNFGLPQTKRKNATKKRKRVD